MLNKSVLYTRAIRKQWKGGRGGNKKLNGGHTCIVLVVRTQITYMMVELAQNCIKVVKLDEGGEVRPTSMQTPEQQRACSAPTVWCSLGGMQVVLMCWGGFGQSWCYWGCIAGSGSSRFCWKITAFKLFSSRFCWKKLLNYQIFLPGKPGRTLNFSSRFSWKKSSRPLGKERGKKKKEKEEKKISGGSKKGE